MVTKLRDLPEGIVFRSLDESGGSLYHKTAKVDQFGEILCDSVYNATPFDVFDSPHWHSPYERVEIYA